MRLHKLGLVTGRKHNHSVMFVRVPERRENLSADPEIRMVHMGSFGSLRHAQGNAAKLGGSHRPHTYIHIYMIEAALLKERQALRLDRRDCSMAVHWFPENSPAF